MTRRVVQIIEQIPMSEVRNIAAKYHYNAFPIVTLDGRLVGMITKGDLLRVARTAMDDSSVWLSPVSHFMAHGVLALQSTEPVGSAIDQLVESGLRSLPVIDADARVIGMVSRNDLMNAIASETA